MIPIDEIVRTRRRTLALIVEEDGRLIARAPMRMGEAAIRAFVREKEKWILKRQEQVRQRRLRFAPKRYVAGERFLYLGDPYELTIEEVQRSPLVLNGGFKLARRALPRAEAVFERWYRRRALQVLTERVEWYAGRHGFEHAGVKVSSARKQWGSCAPDGRLRFAWRLIMAPPEIIDGIVVHELVHLKHRNHSKRFWRKVASILPDFRARNHWLEENGYLLNLS